MGQPSGFKCDELLVTKVTVTTGTFTLLAPNKERIHFYTRRETDDFYIAFQKAPPTSTDEMMLVDATVAGEFLDGSMVCTSRIWVYHEKGSDLDIKYREAVQS